MLKQVKKTIREYRLINKGDKLVLGVSGGPDSVALLLALDSLKKELSLKLHVAHLDHKLRKDSRSDAEFVRRLAEKLGIPVTISGINIRALSSKGSIEEIARNARLGFLFGICRKIKADKLVLGHNLDDQAETVLMRILRGAGLYGLSGILPRRNIAGYAVIRPLIEVRRKEIEAFLKKRRIKACSDISNTQDIYFRNKIRNKLLPLLEKGYNKNIKEILANMGQNLGSDYDYMDKAAERAAGRFKVKIPLSKLLKMHPAIQRLIFRHCMLRLKGDMRRLTFQHSREIEDLLLNRPLNSIVDLPKGVSVIKKKGHLLFYHR